MRTDSGRFTLEETLPACLEGEVQNVLLLTGMNLYFQHQLFQSLLVTVLVCSVL